jgi:predicted Kef-type K+ transport protein
MGSAWTGWIGFACIVMVVIGMIDAFQGLIAVIRGSYYTHVADQIIIFDTTGWGVIMIIWGIALALAGRALLSGASWGRWFAIVAICLNLLIQLAWVGSAAYPLWALCGIALSITVLYALIVRWQDAVSQ